MAQGDHPIAFLLTWTTHGSWLHGDVRRSVDRLHDEFGSPFVEPDATRLHHERVLAGAVVTLSRTQRDLISEAIAMVCMHRTWTLHAANVRTNHVHVTIACDESPERAMNVLKSWATRRLTEAREWSRGERLWTRHGSTRYLWRDEHLRAAIEYVRNQ